MENNTAGIVTVSKRAVKQLVRYSAEKCEGVLSVTSPSKKKKFSDLIFKKDELDAIAVKLSRQGAFVDVNIELENGADRSTVCKSVEEAVKNPAKQMGISISRVNVIVREPEE